MATAKKRLLSGSTDGRMILVTATASAGTTIHTAVAGTTAGTVDEIWLYAINHHTANLKLTIEFGGTTSPNDTIVVWVPYDSGLFLVVPGMILQNGSVVRAFTTTTGSQVSIGGWVNTITD